MERFKWDVIAVCETHWTGMHEIHLKEVTSVGKQNFHRSGVGLMISFIHQR